MANVPGLDYGVKPIHNLTKRDSVLSFETNQPTRSGWFSRGGSGIIGSVISAGAGLLGSYIDHRRAEKADKRNYERYLESRRYNSPAAAAARMRAAGLDPRSVTGQIAGSAAASTPPSAEYAETAGVIGSAGAAAGQMSVAAGQMDIDSMRQAVEAEKAYSDMFLSSKSAERLVEDTNNLRVQGAIIQSQQRIQAVIEELQIGRGRVKIVESEYGDRASVHITGGALYLDHYTTELSTTLAHVISNLQIEKEWSTFGKQVNGYIQQVAVDYNTAVIMKGLSDEGFVLPAYELRKAVQEFYRLQKDNEFYEVDKIAGYITLGLEFIDTILDFLPSKYVKNLGKYLGKK